MKNLLKEAHRSLYQAQLKLAAALQDKPDNARELEYWCRRIQDLMDEMEKFIPYSPFGFDPRTNRLTDEDVELLKKK